MFRQFILAALELAPWLLDPLREIVQADGEGDNRLSIDPNG
jgi:hypothetical protein